MKHIIATILLLLTTMDAFGTNITVKAPNISPDLSTTSVTSSPVSWGNPCSHIISQATCVHNETDNTLKVTFPIEFAITNMPSGYQLQIDLIEEKTLNYPVKSFSITRNGATPIFPEVINSNGSVFYDMEMVFYFVGADSLPNYEHYFKYYLLYEQVQ